MNPRITFRLIIYFATIMLLMAAIGWIAHTSWRRIDDLHEQLTLKQWKSFQIADHLQQSILELNNLMLRYDADRDANDWTSFTSVSVELSHWLEGQKPILSSPKEQPFLDRINDAYQDYQKAAAALHTKIYGANQAVIRLREFAGLEKESKRILDLGIQLSETHQQSIDAIQRQNLKSLNVLRFELIAALVVLLGAVIWLAVVVYRELIAPLQVQLVESRELAERQEKLASLGMLAAGVAHEIRNPLTAIKAWLYLQQKHLKPGSPESEDAELIGTEINRLERIVKDFLQFARPSEPQMTVLSAELPLQEIQVLMQPGLEKLGIKIVIEEVAPARIRVDAQQIKQVLINLVQNAADSIGQDGTVTLRSRLERKRINSQDMDAVILEVSDTGKGIPPEAEKRLFDPFFTTKETGTGLGLPIAARIVEKNGGVLQYQTRLEHGTTFGIILPLEKT
jgi:signal transduction histidine kinase